MILTLSTQLPTPFFPSPRLPSPLLSSPPLPPSPPLPSHRLLYPTYSTFPITLPIDHLPYPTLLYSPLPYSRIASHPFPSARSPPLPYPIPCPTLSLLPSTHVPHLPDPTFPPLPYPSLPYPLIISFMLRYPLLPFATVAACPWVCLSVRTHQQVWQAERRTATHTARMYS